MIDRELLKSAENGNKRAGQSSLIKYLTGGKLYRSQAIAAKCYDCNGMGESSTCDTLGCALYPFSPYNR